MFRNLLGAILLVSVLLPIQSALAETRIGLGLGVLYNGIGFNYSKSTENGLAFGSVGCLRISTGGGSIETDGVVTSEADTTDTNCGVGFGFFSTDLFTGSRHTVGASVALNYNPDTVNNSGMEWSVIPGYVYFPNGVESRGLNLGVGGVFTYSDDDSDNPGILFNIGFHF